MQKDSGAERWRPTCIAGSAGVDLIFAHCLLSIVCRIIRHPPCSSSPPVRPSITYSRRGGRFWPVAALDPVAKSDLSCSGCRQNVKLAVRFRPCPLQMGQMTIASAWPTCPAAAITRSNKCSANGENGSIHRPADAADRIRCWQQLNDKLGPAPVAQYKTSTYQSDGRARCRGADSAVQYVGRPFERCHYSGIDPRSF